MGGKGRGAERGKIQNWNGEEEEKFGVFVAQPERRKLDNFVLCLARRHFVDGGGLEKQLPYCCFPPMWMILQLACMLEFPPLHVFPCLSSAFSFLCPLAGRGDRGRRRKAGSPTKVKSELSFSVSKKRRRCFPRYFPLCFLESRHITCKKVAGNSLQ